MTQQMTESRQDAIPRRPAGRLGKVALAVGIVSVIPGVGVVAAPAGAVLAASALLRKKAGRGTAAAALVLCAAGMAVSLLTVPRALRWHWGLQQAQCATRLKHLAGGIQEYRGIQKRFPATLGELVDLGTLPGAYLSCPAAGRGIGYFYRPPAADAPPDAIMACDRRGNHRGGRNVLYRGGSVRWFSEPAFQAELAKPWNAEFAKALRLAEGP